MSEWPCHMWATSTSRLTTNANNSVVSLPASRTSVYLSPRHCGTSRDREEFLVTRISHRVPRHRVARVNASGVSCVSRDRRFTLLTLSTLLALHERRLTPPPSARSEERRVGKECS